MKASTPNSSHELPGPLLWTTGPLMCFYRKLTLEGRFLKNRNLVAHCGQCTR